MGDGDIDYSGYTLLELKEALAGIDKGRYPGNYANLRMAYRALTGAVPEERTAGREMVEEREERPLPPRYDASGRYIPNRIPKSERNGNLVFSILLFAYGSIGVWINDLYIPGRRSRGTHLHDVPAWIMYAAMICACVVMLSVVVDHYDRRDNERHYRAFSEGGKYVGWALFGASLFWSLFGGSPDNHG